MFTMGNLYDIRKNGIMIIDMSFYDHRGVFCCDILNVECILNNVDMHNIDITTERLIINKIFNSLSNTKDIVIKFDGVDNNISLVTIIYDFDKILNDEIKEIISWGWYGRY